MSITLTALQKQRTDTAANWTSANPTLLSGELGFESDTGKMKLGNGSTAWNSLAYLILIPSSGVYPGTQLIMPAGTNALPSLTFVGDTNTGIYSSGADEVSVATAGTNRFFIGSDGRIGMGMQSPDRRLVIQHTGTADIGLYGSSGTVKTFINASATNGNIGTTTNHDFNFYTNANVRAVIKADGKVGIGTSSPSTRLEVQDNNTLISLKYASDAGSALLSWKNTAGTTLWSIGGGIATAQDELAFVRQGTTVAKFDSSGRLGIGTTSPSSLLDVRSGTSPNAANLLVGLSGSNNYFVANNNIFQDGASNERARIDSSGRWLLGTSSTSANLTAVFQGRSDTSTGAAIVTISVGANNPADGASLGAVNFSDSGHVRSAQISAARDGGTWTSGTSMPTRLVFSTTADGASSPTERMRISQNGRVSLNSNATAGLLTGSSLNTNTDVLNFYMQGTGGGTGRLIVFGNDSVEVFRVLNNGNVQNANNSYAGTSDAKLKENIVDANNQWDDIKALKVRNYNFKEGQTHTQIGLIAQEVELVSPGLVSESPDRDEDGNDLGTVTKAVNYSVLYMKAVKALQEAMERIEQLEAQMAEVKAQLS